MSEANALNVEDDAQTPPVAETPPAAPETPPETPPATPESDDIDLNAVDFKDEGRIKGLIGELSRKRAENRTLKAQAERATQLEAEAAANRPYVDFVRNNPQLLQPRQPEPEKPTAPDADPDAVEAARLMDFYKADGSPDVERGGRWLALQDRRSGRVAQQAVQPWAQQTERERANANYVQLRTFATANNIRQEIVDGIWQMAEREPNGLRTLSNPDSVRALALLAMGANTLATPKQPAPPAKEPLITESAGGRATTPAQRLSGLEERTLQQRGLTPAKYEELTKGFKPGQSNVLED